MTEMTMPSDQLVLLRESGRLIDGPLSHEAANYIYAQFGSLPGGAPFVYDLATRIDSTAHLIDFLVARFQSTPVDADAIVRMFHAIGASHARAGLPITLLDVGPEVFASSLARVVTEHGGKWTPSYSSAWCDLMRRGVEIQRQAYTAQS